MSSSSDEMTDLRAQIATLTAEKRDLGQTLAMQGHDYRGCRLVLDETQEEVVQLQAKLKDSEEKRATLKAGMQSIRELTDKALSS